MQLNKLYGFKNHPFKVETNTALFKLMRSIENDGILDPLLVRPKPDGNGFEIIAGHRRKAACYSNLQEFYDICPDTVMIGDFQ